MREMQDIITALQGQPRQMANPEWGMTDEQIAELEQLARRRAMTQELAKQPQGVQMVGGVAVPRGRGEAIARLITGLGGQFADQDASSRMQDIRKNSGQQAQAEMQQVMQRTSPQEQISAALQSQYPGIRQQGMGWQSQQAKVAAEKQKQEAAMAELAFKEMQSNNRQAAGLYGDRNQPNDALNVLQRGMGQGRPPNIGPMPEPEIRQGPNNSLYALTTEKGGVRDVKGLGGMNVGINLPGKEAEIKLGNEIKELSDSKSSAQSAMADLGNVNRLIRAVDNGAKLGGGTSVAQAAAKFGEFFGIQFPVTGPTDTARSALETRVIDAAKKLAPVTETDVNTVRRMVGSIDTSPSAVAELSAWYSAHALKAIQDHESLVGEKQKLSTGADYSTYLNGIRAPQQLFGPQWFQMLVMQALSDQGGNLSKFAGPDGLPIGQPVDKQGRPITGQPPMAPRFNITPRAFGGGDLPPGVRPLNRGR